VSASDIKFSKGSEWRKWDLHVHTPSSIINGFGGPGEDIWDKYISDLENLPADFKVLGINDYLFLDGYKRLMNEKKNNGRLQNIELLLPVLEFRIEKFAGTQFGHLKRLNLHVIFSDELPIATIESQFLNTLHQGYKLSHGFAKTKWDGVITRKSLEDLGNAIKETVPPDKLSGYPSDLELGFNNLNLDEKQICKSLKKPYFEKKCLIAIGKTEWDQLRWTEGTISEKKDIINSADIVFTAAESIDKYKKAKERLKENGVNDLLLDCSDAHSFSESANKDRIGNCNTWIKADPTFEGLRQILNEPDERVYVGEKPPKVRHIENNKTKYIDRLEITKAIQSKLEENWFDNKVYFNHGLVAIIGNKGSGKSALADIIGLLGKTKNSKHFSFLNDDKFKKIKNNKADHFVATLEWHDNKILKGQSLNSNISLEEVERVRYLPQNFLESICNDLSKDLPRKRGAFEETLEEVIFLHLDEAERQGMTSLNELITYKTKESRNAIENHKFNLLEKNREIVRLEGLCEKQHKDAILNQINKKNNEIKEHKKNKPEEMKKPADTAKSGVYDSINSDINKKQNELNELDMSIEVAKNKKFKLVKMISKIDELEKKIRTFELIYEKFKKDSDLICIEIGVAFENLVKHDVTVDPLEDRKRSFLIKQKVIIESLNIEIEGSLLSKRLVLESNIKDLRAKLDEPNKKYQQYLSETKEWEFKKKILEGGIGQIDSLKHFEHLLQEAQRAPGLLLEVRDERFSLLKLIYEEITGIKSIYETYYAPVQSFIDKNTKDKGILAGSNLEMNFEASIVVENFNEIFSKYIDHGTKSSFRGIEASDNVVTELLKQTDFNDYDDLKSFIDKIFQLLTEHKTETLEIKNQLRQGQSVESLYNFIFSLDYLRPKYSLTWDGKKVDELSPGEKGTLLLIFYLLIDKEDIPIIIDQPEENLDNETVYKVLVPCIKAAKQKRQVIIVTHNPNLAVVCDAEQIICASIDKQDGYKVSYASGSIENRKINQKIIDILEGTRPAFDNRDHKYIS